MSADNVTPIRAGSEPPPARAKPKRPRAPRKCRRFHLIEPANYEPDNARLIEALHGVCYMMEHASRREEREHMDEGTVNELASAAEILSNMLIDRIDPGIGD